MLTRLAPHQASRSLARGGGNTRRAGSTLRSHGRFDYVPLARPHRASGADAPTWPGGKRLAVYLAINLEHFAFGEGLGGTLAPSGRHPR